MQVINFFSSIKEFQINNKTSGAYLTCLFWGAGTRARKLNGHSRNYQLLDDKSHVHSSIPIWNGEK